MKKNNSNNKNTQKTFVRPTPVTVINSFTNTKEFITQLIQINPYVKRMFFINPECPADISDMSSESLAVVDTTMDHAIFDDIVDILTDYFCNVVNHPHLINHENTAAALQCSANKVYIRPNNEFSFTVKALYHLDPSKENPRRKIAVIDSYEVKYTTYTGDESQITKAEELGWTKLEQSAK